MTRLSIRLLGPFQVALDGEPAVGFRSDKVRALLAYLSVEHQKAHRRETLAALLWPEWPESSARTNLRQALSNLRQVIGDRPSSPDDAADPHFLQISRQSIQFNLESDAWIDVLAFAAFTDSHSVAEGADEETIKRFEEAVGLYRGEFLEGFSLPDSPPFEEWALLQREQSHRLVIQALHQLIDAYSKQGDLETALQRTWRVLELSPWREQAHRQAMRLLALTDQRSAALAQYERCRRLLSEELGVEPAAETDALYEQIRSGELKPATRSRPISCASGSGLPASLIPLVGREAELASLERLLADPSSRLITLVGPGGSGKTRLAVEAASSAKDRFAQGVTFVSLAGVTSADAIVPAVARALGFCFSPAEESVYRDPEDQLIDYLAGKDLLLVLDNLEHLLDGADVITGILAAAARVTVLATSRVKLNVPGEYLFPVPGMDYPTRAGPAAGLGAGHGDVDRFSAVKLFIQAARQLQPDFSPTEEDLPGIARVCRLVQGMPLGILLAAAWAEVLTPGEIAAEIEKGLDFLETGWRAVPERQRSLRAVFDHSWSLLTDRKREAFKRLSVFRGGFTREAAEELGASLGDLRSLVSRSFLQRSTLSGRYEVHELLRTYAAEKLAASPRAETAARDRHSAHYTAELERFVDALQGPRQRAAVAKIEADSENVLEAWHWGVRHKRIERLDQAMEGLARFCRRRGRYQEGEAAFRMAADTLTSLDPTHLALSVTARALIWQSYFSRALGRREEATRLRKRALAFLEQPEFADRDTRAERALLYHHMGRAVFLSDYERARGFLEESLALYRELGDRWRTAAALQSLGTAALFRGSYAEARAALEESMAICRALSDREGTAWNMADLTFVAIRQGRFDEARQLARDSMAITQALGDREGVGFGLLARGASLNCFGEFAEARAVLVECLQVFDDLGRSGWTDLAHFFLGRADLHLGRYNEAHQHAESALSLARRSGLRLRIGQALVLLARVALAGQAHGDAQRLARQGLDIHREIGAAADAAKAHVALAYAAEGLDEPAASAQHVRRALETADATGDVVVLMWTLPVGALLLARHGAAERAVELGALASRYPLVGESRWFEAIAGERLAATAESLPPDAAAAAQERGREADLRATAAELMHELAPT